MIKLNAKQLRHGQNQLDKALIPRNPIYIILDNVLDTYNIGSIFRLADAVGAKKIYLCGGSETPPNHRIKKSSINTTEIVEWEYCQTTLEAIKRVRGEALNVKVVAVELAENSVPYTEYKYQLPLALVVGHESDGVSSDVLQECDAIVQLPMYGVNVSLNVMVSLAIVLYEVLRQTKTSTN